MTVWRKGGALRRERSGGRGGDSVNVRSLACGTPSDVHTSSSSCRTKAGDVMLTRRGFTLGLALFSLLFFFFFLITSTHLQNVKVYSLKGHLEEGFRCEGHVHERLGDTREA